MTSGGPLPTTRYPTAPAVVWATRTGADTTEAVPGASLGGEEPQAVSAAASNAATRIKALPRRAVTVATIRPGLYPPQTPRSWGSARRWTFGFAYIIIINICV
jgi:hypothetical protein